MQKSLFRNESLARLNLYQNGRYHAKDHKVIKSLYKIIKNKNAKTLLLYLPLKIEVNIKPLIKTLRQEGRTLFVPFMEGESFRLVKYRLPLKRKKFGIKEPKKSNQYRMKKIDLAIVPMVGTDRSLRRVGFGKGMYDRFFAKEKAHIKKVLFVARRLCFADSIVTDHYDVVGDTIITPEKIINRKKRYHERARG
jgi:5-formyltetrahydrofolate cyclo-ligase